MLHILSYTLLLQLEMLLCDLTQLSQALDLLNTLALRFLTWALNLSSQVLDYNYPEHLTI